MLSRSLARDLDFPLQKFQIPHDFILFTFLFLEQNVHKDVNAKQPSILEGMSECHMAAKNSGCSPCNDVGDVDLILL